MASPVKMAKMREQDAELASGPMRKMDRTHLVSARTLDWTSRRSPGSSVGEALESNVDAPPQVHVGIRALKVTSYGKLKRRVLTVSNDFYAVFVTHGKVASGEKGMFSRVAKTLKTPLLTRKGWSKRDMYVRYIDVADIDYIQTGIVGTYNLEAVGGKSAAKGRLRGKNSLMDTQAGHTVSIIHHGSKTLDFLIASDTQREALVKCLEDMIKVYRDAMLNVGNEELLLRYIWYDIDTTNDGLIQKDEFVKMTSRINLYIGNPGKLYKKYLTELKESKTNSNQDGLSYHESMCLLQRIKTGYYTKEGESGSKMKQATSGLPQKKSKKAAQLPAMALWDDVFGANVEYVSCDDFLNKFLRQRQGDTEATPEDVLTLVRKVNNMEVNRENDTIKQNQLSKTRFEVYLMSTMNDAYDPKAQEFDRSTLKEPLSHYWINTSHNTYLMGDQLRSMSSVSMYMEAMRRGCKCLELDCWDGEKSMWGEHVPIVFHGHTLTSRISFGDIIKGVKNYVDANPDTYPIILSLENHCSHPYQETMAKILTETLGDSLFIPYASAKEAREAENEVLRSPDSLRGKVLIKGKRPPDDEGDDEDEETAAEEEEEDPYEADESANSPKGISSKKKDDKDAKPPKVVKELARMTLFHGTKYKSFDKSIELPTAHMHSIGETKINKILKKDKDNANLWRKYNVRHMTRTYPAGSRVDSSNYNPVLAWSMGCQLVALNFQTNDAPLLLNDGRFRQNGGCGYVLKPKSVMGYTTGRRTPATLKVKILSGSCLPKPSGAKEGETIDPYVQVTVHDVVVDEKSGCEEYAMENFCTDCVDDNGFCPIWSRAETDKSRPIEKEFTIQDMDAAMIIFSLWEQDLDLDDKVADAAIPLSCLRKGVRSIQLYEPNGTRSGPFGMATLLVEIDF